MRSLGSPVHHHQTTFQTRPSVKRRCISPRRHLCTSFGPDPSRDASQVTPAVSKRELHTACMRVGREPQQVNRKEAHCREEETGVRFTLETGSQARLISAQSLETTIDRLQSRQLPPWPLGWPDMDDLSALSKVLKSAANSGSESAFWVHGPTADLQALERMIRSSASWRNISIRLIRPCACQSSRRLQRFWRSSISKRW